MRPYNPGLAVSALSIGLLTALPAAATPFFFSTGDPDGKIATASRPTSAGKVEIESADDFGLTDRTRITSATFTGLLTGAAPSIGEVVVEIYRVFPKDSDVGRTSGPPVFSTLQVPTRVNSPSDVAFADRDSAAGNLTFLTATLGSFTANNSVLPGGIHPFPNQTTGGNGAVTGTEVQFTVTFTTPFDLPADHFFFIPQVEVSGGEFLWLSAPKPIVPPGTPFPPGFNDLQSWIRDENLQPDWLRIGTDIVGAGAFNATFSLTGQTIPEPASIGLLAAALSAMTLAGLRRRRS
jgi:hypothetical protein